MALALGPPGVGRRSGRAASSDRSWRFDPISGGPGPLGRLTGRGACAGHMVPMLHVRAPQAHAERGYAIPWVPQRSMVFDGGAQRIEGWAARPAHGVPGLEGWARARGLGSLPGSRAAGLEGWARCRAKSRCRARGRASKTGRQVEMVASCPGQLPGARRQGAKKRPGDEPGRFLEVWCRVRRGRVHPGRRRHATGVRLATGRRRARARARARPRGRLASRRRPSPVA